VEVKKTDATAVKIGTAIIRFNSTEITQTDVTMDSEVEVAKVRKLTGRNRVAENQGQLYGVTAEILNHHYASILNDPLYIKPDVKMTTNQL